MEILVFHVKETGNVTITCFSDCNVCYSINIGGMLKFGVFICVEKLQNSVIC